MQPPEDNGEPERGCIQQGFSLIQAKVAGSRGHTPGSKLSVEASPESKNYGAEVVHGTNNGRSPLSGSPKEAGQNQSTLPEAKPLRTSCRQRNLNEKGGCPVASVLGLVTVVRSVVLFVLVAVVWVRRRVHDRGGDG